MQPLSLWAMIWQLGVFCSVAVGVVLLVGFVVFLMFKPINYLDQL